MGEKRMKQYMIMVQWARTESAWPSKSDWGDAKTSSLSCEEDFDALRREAEKVVNRFSPTLQNVSGGFTADCRSGLQKDVMVTVEARCLDQGKGNWVRVSIIEDFLNTSGN